MVEFTCIYWAFNRCVLFFFSTSVLRLPSFFSEFSSFFCQSRQIRLQNIAVVVLDGFFSSRRYRCHWQHRRFLFSSLSLHRSSSPALDFSFFLHIFSSFYRSACFSHWSFFPFFLLYFFVVDIFFLCCCCFVLYLYALLMFLLVFILCRSFFRFFAEL